MVGSKRLLKRKILNADRLTIREGVFIECENGKFVGLLYEYREFLKSVMKEMNYEASYRVYFSIPYRLWITVPPPSGKRNAAAPKGSGSELDTFLKGVNPIWTNKIEGSWFELKFHQLDEKLESVWSELLEDHNGNLPTVPWEFSIMKNSLDHLPDGIRIEKGCVEKDVISALDRDVNSLLNKYLAVLGLEGGSRRAKFDLGERVYETDLDFAYTGSENEGVLFVIEFKRHGLINKVNKRSIKDSEGMNSIMKQVLKEMAASETDCCLISDVEVSILVQLDFQTKIAPSSDKNVANVPFKFHVFYPDDPIHTIQAIICSVVYDQKMRAGDPIQKENAKKLRDLIVKESFIVPDGNDESRESSRPGSSMSQLTSPPSTIDPSGQLPPIGEQSSSSENEGNSPGSEHGTNPNTNENKSLNQYKQLEFILNEGEFEILQPGGYYATTVVKLNRIAIDRILSHLNLPPSVSHVIIKFYDWYNAGFYIKYNKLHITCTEHQRSMREKFHTEIECYQRTSRYNEARDSEKYVRVPKLYEYRGGKIIDGRKMLSYGWYLIIEYIEKDQDQVFNLKDAECQIRLLGSLGIQHNDIHERNIAVSEGKFTLIDFSEAKLDNIDVGWDLRMLENVWIENRKLHRTEEVSESFIEG